MVRNYFIIAWRNFLKHKFVGIVNIIGISFGMAIVLLAFLFIYDEFSFDDSHKNRDLIYRIETAPVINELADMSARSVIHPLPFAPALKQSITGIEYATRYDDNSSYIIVNGKQLLETIYYVDEDFTRMFTFEYIEKNSEEPLSNINEILISERKALKLFSTLSAVGKTIQIDSNSYVVSGVFKSLPRNSSFDCELLVRYENFYPYKKQRDDWNASYTPVFVQLELMMRPDHLIESLKKFTKTHLVEAGWGETQLIFTPLSKVHFDSQIRWHNVSNIKYTYILGGVALVILLIACTNYILLSLAGSLARAREVGVRKVIGATQQMIRSQFLSESLILITLAIPISFLILYRILPEFNTFMSRSIELSSISAVLILALICVIILTGLVAGGYPAVVLSRLVPEKILKNNLNGNFKAKFSSTLIVFQFFACFVLIICSLVMVNQMKMIQNRDLGFTMEQVIVIDATNDLGIEGRKILENFRTELEHEKNILMLSGIARDFGSLNGSSSRTDSTGKVISEFYASVDFDFFELLNIKPNEGRLFSRDFPADTTNRYVVNEAFAKQIGLNAVPGKMPRDPNIEIIGVVPNFNFQSLEHEVKPFAFVRGKNFRKIFVKLSPENIQGSIARLEQCWNKVVGEGNLKYEFLDDQLTNQYQRYTQWMRLITIAAGLAIGIACLGLFGAMSLAVLNRTKEIGIRKVLGASTAGIFELFAKHYLVLVSISFCLAGPAAYYFSSIWLSDFAYKIEIDWSNFIYPFAGIIGLTTLIIGTQIVKATKINPVETLKSE